MLASQKYVTGSGDKVSNTQLQAGVNAEGVLCALDTHVLVTGVVMDNDLHAHWSVSVLIAGGEPFEFRSGDSHLSDCCGVVVRPGTPQCMRSRDARVLVVHLDPDSPEYAAVGGWIEATPWRLLAAGARKRILACLGKDGMLQGVDHARKLLREILSVLGESGGSVLKRDPRVRRVCELIAANPLASSRPHELATAVGLSVSRLQHLFREELGITLTDYVRWQRIKRAGLSLQHGYSLTEAAHAGGFADSAHFSRTFRAMFGLPPSTLVRGSSAVQVLFAPLTDNSP